MIVSFLRIRASLRRYVPCAIDGSMKKVYKKYFVENQTSKASIKLIKTAAGCEKLLYELLQKCLILN